MTAFTVVPCQCSVAYDGQFCENDRDGCADNPCDTGGLHSDVLSLVGIGWKDGL